MARNNSFAASDPSPLNTRPAMQDNQIYDYPPDLDFETMQELFRRSRQPSPAPSPGYKPRSRMVADASGETLPMELAGGYNADELPELWRTVLENGAGQRMATPSNAAAKRDAGDFGEEMPPIWQSLLSDGVKLPPSTGRSMVREGGRIPLAGLGPELEAYFSGQDPEAIRAEMQSFRDERPGLSAGAYGTGAAAAAAIPAKALFGGLKATSPAARPTEPKWTLAELLARVDAPPPSGFARLGGQDMPMLMNASLEPGLQAEEQYEPPTQEELDFQNMNPVDALKMSAELENKRVVPEWQAAKNRGQNVRDLLSIIPGPGNYIAGEDAINSFGAMGDEIGEENYGKAALAGGFGALSTLGAVTGLPFGKAAGRAAKGASSRANIFMSADPDLDREFDKAMRISEDMSGAPLVQRNAAMFPKTGLFMSPEGILKKEVSDFNTAPGAALTGNSAGPATAKAGDVMTMGEAMPHPAYARDPELAEMLVRLNNDKNSAGQPISRTNALTGDFEMSLGNKGPRAQLLKALQYEIQGKDARFAAGARHGAGVNESELAHITGRLDEAARRALDGGNPALAAKLGPYRQMLADTGDEIESARSMVGKPLGDPDFVSDMVKSGRAYRANRMDADRLGANPEDISLTGPQMSNSINDFLYARSAGQQEKTLAQARVGIRPDQAGRADPLSSWWQYKKEVPPNFEKFTYGDPDSLIALPRSNVTDEQMIEFALNWARHGAGSGR